MVLVMVVSPSGRAGCLFGSVLAEEPPNRKRIRRPPPDVPMGTAQTAAGLYQDSNTIENAFIGEIMRKLAIIACLVPIAMAVSIGAGEAGWKKRGWYLKNEAASCVMREVTVTNAKGKVVIRKVRVCG
jgi:hypothetical protein